MFTNLTYFYNIGNLYEQIVWNKYYKNYYVLYKLNVVTNFHTIDLYDLIFTKVIKIYLFKNMCT